VPHPSQKRLGKLTPSLGGTYVGNFPNHHFVDWTASVKRTLWPLASLRSDANALDDTSVSPEEQSR